MTTGQDQTQTLYDAAARTRAGVPTRASRRDVDEAIEYFGPDLASHVGRYDTGELFVPLEVWLGKWEPGASLVLQDRAVLVWGRTEVKAQIIPRKRPGGVAEVDVQPDAVTLWIDCEQPAQRARPALLRARWTCRRRSPTRSAPSARDREPTAELPPADGAVPALLRRDRRRAPRSARTAAATSAPSPSARRSG